MKNTILACPECPATVVWGKWTKEKVDRTRANVLLLRCPECFDHYMKENCPEKRLVKAS